MENQTLNAEQRINLVAERIFNYYMQIIAHYKKNNITSFVIDSIGFEEYEMPLVTLEDKYDGKSRWRDALGMLEDDADWHTLGSDVVARFAGMGADENGRYFIKMKEVLQKASLLLSKKGIANYFEKPAGTLKNYFHESDEIWLMIVL
jgi:hypothetical protein